MAGILSSIYSVGILLVALGLGFATLWVTRDDDRPIRGVTTLSSLLVFGAVAVFLVALVVKYAF
ncbi:hypothetical protein SAMN04487950_1299 [Halogranum rubrum]|uniref:Uncharacterized protein n=2 Tax=Halogranum rubrum TaxID=553466 RepID=A0A1I4CNB8_9EURY|nr:MULTISPECIES: hypothetical protein [Halogranum]EJN59204.1 hypothetical protein HSB1_26250 [Halogranum salarium B-1]SFK82738.1 hypothetical protein SAMN04487950_1299 [Halogranum rubrum]